MPRRDEVALVQPKSKVGLYAAIRRDSRAGLSIRAIQSKHNVGSRTVEKALALVWPAPRKPLAPLPSWLDAYKPLIDQMLRVDQIRTRRPSKGTHRLRQPTRRAVAGRTSIWEGWSRPAPPALHPQRRAHVIPKMANQPACRSFSGRG